MKNLKEIASQFREEVYTFLDIKTQVAKSGIAKTIDDMKARLAAGKELVAAAMAEEERLKRAYQEAVTAAKAWGDKADAALKKGQTALAREALQQQQKSRSHLARLHEQLETQKGVVVNLKATLQEYYRQFQNAVERSDFLQARQKQAATRVDFYQIFNRNPEEAVFKEAEQQLKETEAQADSLQNADVAPKPSSEGGKQNVDAALAQLKDDVLGK